MIQHRKVHEELMIIATILFVALSLILILFTETGSLTGNAVFQTSLTIIEGGSGNEGGGGGSGGGSSSTPIELSEIECGEWGECIDGTKTRECEYSFDKGSITQTITCIDPRDFVDLSDEDEFPEENIPPITEKEFIDIRIRGLDGDRLQSITQEWKNLEWDDILVRISCDEQIIYFADGAVIYNPGNELLKELLPSPTYEEYLNCFEKEPETVIPASLKIPDKTSLYNLLLGIVVAILVSLLIFKEMKLLGTDRFSVITKPVKYMARYSTTIFLAVIGFAYLMFSVISYLDNYTSVSDYRAMTIVLVMMFVSLLVFMLDKGWYLIKSYHKHH